MAIHPKDTKAANPRMQCSVCAKWMRLHGRDENGQAFQRFYGGCGFTMGDHLAGNKTEVCHECCQIECKRLKCEAA